MISWGQLANTDKLSDGSCGPMLSREMGNFLDASFQCRTVLERVMVINMLKRISLEALGVEGNWTMGKD